ncbi:hypothetical protein [Halorubellus litoreus]|uniref:Uncharacterized protein n=1 Tax=Halorubellus litoreus TaxID=755308 RepID=A0ABD5VI12_9EURY
MGVEDLLTGFVERRLPERPEWVAANPRTPRVAARVYGTFAFAFSTLFFAIAAFVVVHPGTLVFVPVVVANAVAWTWVLWHAFVPDSGALSRRRTVAVGTAIGTLSWLTVGPLVFATQTGYSALTGAARAPTLSNVLAGGTVYSIGGFVATLGIPTVASVALALWTLDHEEQSGREKRESTYQFQ